MGVTSLILGIVALITGIIPFVCFFSFALAIIGLTLGIADTIKKSKNNNSKRGISIAGLIISAVAIPAIIISSLISIVTFGIILNDDIIPEINERYDEEIEYNFNEQEWDDYLNWKYENMLDNLYDRPI